ncbi:MAG TPA: hypothetical protein VD927_19785 [Chryseosolibacter sp.]|nr:hypothetical protein [Chryseosolibacter sp.]
MKRIKHIKFITAVAAVSISAVLTLYSFSEHVRTREGTFIRIFPPHPVLHNASLRIDVEKPYIAGHTDRSLYIGNEVSPIDLLQIDKEKLMTERSVRVSISAATTLKHFNAHVLVDSSSFYFFDGAIPYLLKGNTDQWLAMRQSTKDIFFQDVVPLGDSTYAVKSFNTRRRENVLAIYNPKTKTVKQHPDLLQRQVDGIFCTDGTLHFAKDTKKVIYLYFYRNEYIVADKDLNLLYRGQTIDTVSKANVKTVTRITGTNTTTSQLAVPPPTVNKHSTVYKHLLLVHSNLMGRNELPELFDEASVIDVYNFLQQKYLFSFYVPDREGKKIRDLKIAGDKLYALYDNRLDAYKLNDIYFTPL